MGSIPQTSGVYQILCIPTGKVYIGSAINLRRRWIAHRRDLRGKYHANSYLQNAWNKYGEDSFSCTVLECCPIEQVLVREQWFIDQYQACDPTKGYNIAPTAGSALGMRHSEETRRAMSASRKGRKRAPYTAEALQNMADAGDLKAQSIDGYIDPDGNMTIIHNLWDFCKRMGLKHSAMWRLASGQGRTKSYKGWTHRDHPYQGRAQVCDGFIDPDGNPVGPIYNLSEFCRQHGLSQSHMQQVYVGKRPHHRGWTYKRDVDGI